MLILRGKCKGFYRRGGETESSAEYILPALPNNTNHINQMNHKNHSPTIWFMSIFYLLAGINHFIHPSSYLQVIPPYLPAHEVLNDIAGVAEITAAILLHIRTTRKLAAWGIVMMLLAFVPVHIYMIQQAPMRMGSLLITPLIAWLRLPLQAVLIFWAYTFTRNR